MNIMCASMAHRSLVRNQMASYLPFDGADASTTFTDITGKSWTAVGNAQIDTAQSVFGGSSLLLDGTGDYVQCADHAEHELGGGGFCLRVRVRFAALPAVSGYDPLFAKWAAAVGQNSWLAFAFNNAGTRQLWFSWSTDGTANSGSVSVNWTPSTNTWYTIQIERVGTTVKFFVDGTQVGIDQTVSDTFFNGTTSQKIGGDGFESTNGWYDEALMLVAATIDAKDYLTMPFPKF